VGGHEAAAAADVLPQGLPGGLRLQVSQAGAGLGQDDHMAGREAVGLEIVQGRYVQAGLVLQGLVDALGAEALLHPDPHPGAAPSGEDGRSGASQGLGGLVFREDPEDGRA